MLLFQISKSYIVSRVLSDSSGVAMVMYWVTALVLPWWCIEWQLWCCHGDVLSDSSGVAVVMYWVTALVLPWWCIEWQLWCCHGDVLSDSSGVAMVMYWVTALVLPWWQKSERCVWTWSYCSSRLNINMYLSYKPVICHVKNDKYYVFNPILTHHFP